MEAIYNYVEGHASQHAFVWFNHPPKTIYTLERFPDRGPVISENKKLRHLLFGNRTSTELFTPSINEFML